MGATTCQSCGQSNRPRPVCPECNNQIILHVESPAWTTVRFFGFLAVLMVMLYSQATNFDETELKVVGLMAVVLAPAMFGAKIGEIIKKAVS